MDYPKPDDDSDDADDCPCSDAPAVSPTLYGDARAELRRRDFAKFLASVGGLTAVASLTAPLASTTQVFERSYEGPVYSDGVHLVDSEGERIRENRLSEGEKMTVFPEPRPGIEDAPTLLVRYPESEYGGDIEMGYTVSGYAAFSKVCTHAGCMVANEDGNLLVCPCHFGKFDPLQGAAVTDGPPGRPLPQLPITVTSDGFLVATGDFEGPIGPGGG
ncbi:Rieske 2Fe-2S domain-containing protein [Halomicroarcula sp. F13]|uniref:Rieske 2Fe-2S domain-containing protein n=1 Tax=Haloarcula rubra TaxID=2487747 RepID=A0AAW4PL29_9EURY|nr:Rieske 2Fe-2S domain-containing protein [Halomicroarcula rubra]MBX0321451.1 Rieske 2Fe-2S domain-containing protein [Halomicroarcula rubra]